jgi:hypothetical protein
VSPASNRSNRPTRSSISRTREFVLAIRSAPLHAVAMLYARTSSPMPAASMLETPARSSTILRSPRRRSVRTMWAQSVHFAAHLLTRLAAGLVLGGRPLLHIRPSLLDRTSRRVFDTWSNAASHFLGWHLRTQRSHLMRTAGSSEYLDAAARRAVAGQQAPTRGEPIGSLEDVSISASIDRRLYRAR